MKKKKQKGAWKRPVASVLGMVLVVTITIIGTLAFMHTESNTRTNVFTGTNDIKLHLEEPSYNLRELQNDNGTVTGYELRNSNKLDPREYVPGEEYSKDPTLYNVTGKQTKKNDGTTVEYAEEWVALRVDYAIDANGNNTIDTGEERDCAGMSDDYVENGAVSQPAGIINAIDFNDADEPKDTNGNYIGGWIKIPSDMLQSGAKYDIYIYKYKLRAVENFENISNDDTGDATLNAAKVSEGHEDDTIGAKTTPLFNSITIKDQDTLKANGYDADKLKRFTIKLTGAAVKVMTTNDLTDGISKSDISKTIDADNPKTTSRLIAEELVSLLE